ncbi:MAG: hypothetical protein ACTSSP_04570 [Candidatus Asgardarchaeia archaeon]
MRRKFLYITRSSKKASITSIFLQVLDNLSKCEKENLIPIVSLKNTNLLCYDSRYGDNLWEYYFEPVSPFSDEILSEKDKKNKKIRSSFMSKPQHLNYLLGIAGKEHSYTSKFKNRVPPEFDLSHRNHFKKIIDKYIKIKPYILEEENDFYNKYMKNKKITGVFVRGTNKFNKKSGGTTFKKRKKLTIKDYMITCKEEMNRTGTDYIYLASDSHESVEIFKKEFNNNLIYQKNNIRYKYHSSDIDPPWGDPDFGPMKGKTKGDLGKENIIETLCLSKCKSLIHTETNIAIAAMLYNPNLENKFIS